MDATVVREALERLLASPGFVHADRLSRCLRYLVDETLAGRQDAIKEYTIGVEIYGRGPDYDPKIDSIVRVEAGRLRAKLKQYYDGAGKDDAVRIDLPRGGYVPVFQNGSRPPPAEPIVAHPARRRPLVLAAAFLTVMALAAVAAFRLKPDGDGQTLSLAVEPLANLSGDPETGRFAAGLTQQLGNNLAQVEGFSVMTGGGRTRARVQGGVERAGDRMRVLLRLVRSSDGYQAWSTTYVSLPGAQMPFNDAISELAVRGLRAQFAGNPARLNGETRASDPEAQGLYIKGREAWNTQRRPGLEQSVAFFRQAIIRDPRFGRPYEGLSASELYLCTFDLPGAAGHLARARQAAQQAIALDDRLWDAHARLGNIYLYHDWNFVAAEHELFRAVILYPGRAEITRWFAMAARLQHHDGEARHELETGALTTKAAEMILSELGIMDYDAGATGSAWRYARLALAADPRYKPAHLLAGWLHQAAGELDLAAGEFISCASPGAYGMRCRAALGELRAREGKTVEARRIARSLPQLFLAAGIYLDLNDREQALHALEQSFTSHESEFPWISVDRHFEPLHGEPRYKDLLRRMGL